MIFRVRVAPALSLADAAFSARLAPWRLTLTVTVAAPDSLKAASSEPRLAVSFSALSLIGTVSRAAGGPAPPDRPVWNDASVRISAKADYAVRAAIELAVAGDERPTKGDAVAQAQGIPLKFLENILADMRHAGLVTSRRGAEGGYWLARPPEEITVADIIRAVEGPLASVRGGRPEDVDYAGSAEPLQKVWIGVRASLRSVVEHVTLADLATGKLPKDIEALAKAPEAWVTRR